MCFTKARVFHKGPCVSFQQNQVLHKTIQIHVHNTHPLVYLGEKGVKLRDGEEDNRERLSAQVETEEEGGGFDAHDARVGGGRGGRGFGWSFVTGTVLSLFAKLMAPNTRGGYRPALCYAPRKIGGASLR